MRDFDAINYIYDQFDNLDQKLSKIDADRHLFRLAVDGLAGTADRFHVDGLHALVDTFDNNVDDVLARADYLHQIIVDLRKSFAEKLQAQKKPAVKKKGKARAAAKKRKIRSK